MKKEIEEIPTIDKEDIPCIDLDKEFWKAIKKAAHDSEWIPPEYMMNDWVADVCTYLKKGIHHV